jgi:hypothetical protein
MKRMMMLAALLLPTALLRMTILSVACRSFTLPPGPRRPRRRPVRDISRS